MIRHHERTDGSTNRRLILLAVITLAISTGSAVAFFCGFDGIILDPANLAKNVLQATALGTQVTRATTQIQLQVQALADLPASVAHEQALANDVVRQILFEDGPDVDAMYPITGTHADVAPGWLDTARRDWTQSERASLATERALSERVQRSMSPTTDRLALLIRASNGVDLGVDELPGPKAVLQAQQELTALHSGELDKLIGLRALRARRKIIGYARRAAIEAYQARRRASLMSDWEDGYARSVRPVRNPFGGHRKDQS